MKGKESDNYIWKPGVRTITRVPNDTRRIPCPKVSNVAEQQVPPAALIASRKPAVMWRARMMCRRGTLEHLEATR